MVQHSILKTLYIVYLVIFRQMDLMWTVSNVCVLYQKVLTRVWLISLLILQEIHPLFMGLQNTDTVSFIYDIIIFDQYCSHSIFDWLPRVCNYWQQCSVCDNWRACTYFLDKSGHSTRISNCWYNIGKTTTTSLKV